MSFSSFSVGSWFTGMLFTVFRPGRMETDVVQYLIAVHSACVLFISIKVYSSFREFSQFITAEWIFRTETSARTIPMWRRFTSFCFTDSLISRVLAFQRALVKLRLSGGNLPVSVCVLLSVFTFELQPESIANVFNVSWLILHCESWCK